jgi:hypothetical protein
MKRRTAILGLGAFAVGSAAGYGAARWGGMFAPAPPPPRHTLPLVDVARASA